MAGKLPLEEVTLLRAAADPKDWAFAGDGRSLMDLLRRGWLESKLEGGNFRITVTDAGLAALMEHDAS